MSAIRALLSDLIDYAGLFPPAELDVTTAVRNYNIYRRGEYGWALGRFVVDTARLNQLRQFDDEAPARLSVLGEPEPSTPNIEALELKASEPLDIEAAIRRVPGNSMAYFEIPLAENADGLVSTLGQHHARAKVRTGGVVESGFPGSRNLVRFVSSCKRANVAWKATAGLHHPVRGVYPLTYEAGSPSCMMHGFVNLFLAAAVLYTGGDEEQALAILEERSAEAFRFDEGGAAWRAIHFSVSQIKDMRRNFAISFGSCSFEEPIADLKALGWL